MPRTLWLHQLVNHADRMLLRAEWQRTRLLSMSPEKFTFRMSQWTIAITSRYIMQHNKNSYTILSAPLIQRSFMALSRALTARMQVQITVHGTGPELDAFRRWLRKDGADPVIKYVQGFLDDLQKQAQSGQVMHAFFPAMHGNVCITHMYTNKEQRACALSGTQAWTQRHKHIHIHTCI